MDGLGPKRLVPRGVPEGHRELFLVRPFQGDRPSREQGTDERKAVRVEARGRETDDRVAGAGRSPVEEIGSLDDADAGPGEVERPRLHEARVLCRLATDQRTARLPAALGDPADQRRDGIRIDAPDGHVIEERERLGPRADHVVRAHRDEIDPDRVPPSECGGQRGLRPDAVGRRDDERLPVPGRDRDGTAESAQTTDHLRTASGIDRSPHPLDCGIARRDVDAGTGVGIARRRALGALISHG